MNELKIFYDNAHRLSVPPLEQAAGQVSLVPLFEKLRSMKILDTDRRLKVLEVGVGTNPSYELMNQYFPIEQYLGLDFSSVAIDYCQKKYASSSTNYLALDAASAADWQEKIGETQYDLIVDAHLLHCLVTDEERSAYLRNIHSSLNVGGIFLGETIVGSSKQLVNFLQQQTSFSAELMQEGYYLQQINGQWLKTRRLQAPFELEQELLKHQLKILYFQIPWGLRLQLNPNRALADFDPEVAYFICQK